MGEFSHVRQLPKIARELTSLVHGICDEQIKHQWLDNKTSNIFGLWVEITKENFHLYWLENGFIDHIYANHLE